MQSANGMCHLYDVHTMCTAIVLLTFRALVLCASGSMRLCCNAHVISANITVCARRVRPLSSCNAELSCDGITTCIARCRHACIPCAKELCSPPSVRNVARAPTLGPTEHSSMSHSHVLAIGPRGDRRTSGTCPVARCALCAQRHKGARSGPNRMQQCARVSPIRRKWC